jgi:hypothetical protein
LKEKADKKEGEVEQTKVERIHEGKKRCSQNKTILVKMKKTIHQCKINK